MKKATILIIILTLLSTLSYSMSDYPLKVVVIDSKTEQPVQYATASILDNKGNQLASGITNSYGRLEIPLNDKTDVLRVSHIGYLSLEQSIDSTNLIQELVVELLPTSHQIEDISIESQVIRHEIDRVLYTVTSTMRIKAFNAEQLALQLPSVRQDILTNNLKVDNQTNILLLVDNMVKSKEYISSLSPDRIASIEVIKNPSGRFITEDYYAIINYNLKKNYSGFEITLGDFAIINPAGTNNKDWLANHQPQVGLNFTNKNIDFYANYGYGDIKFHHPISSEKEYADIYSLKSKKYSTKNPNQHYLYKGHVAIAGINYQINEYHIISLESNYRYDKYSENTKYDYLSTDHITNQQDEFTDDARSNNIDSQLQGTINYTGKLSDKWRLSADITYSRDSKDERSSYTHDSDELISHYITTRNYIKSNIDANFDISPKLRLNFGQTNTSRSYKTADSDGFQGWKYNEYKGRLYSQLTYFPKENLRLNVGASLQYLTMTNSNYFNIEPNFRLNYQPIRNININAGYNITSINPTLYQINNNPIYLDLLMINVGNPNIKPAPTHKANIQFTFWDILTISQQFSYSSKGIKEYYTKQDDKFYRTYRNMESLDLNLMANVCIPIGEYFEVDATAGYHYQKISYESQHNKLHTWWSDLSVEYFNPNILFGASLGYQRYMDKIALLQGYRTNDLDAWMLNMNKMFFKGKLQLQVTYLIPIKFGKRYNQYQEIKTQFYTQREIFSLKTYDNMLFIRLQYKFNKGKDGVGKRIKTNIESDNKESRNILGK